MMRRRRARRVTTKFDALAGGDDLDPLDDDRRRHG
jgi:hypothetical protein